MPPPLGNGKGSHPYMKFKDYSKCQAAFSGSPDGWCSFELCHKPIHQSIRESIIAKKKKKSHLLMVHSPAVAWPAVSKVRFDAKPDIDIGLITCSYSDFSQLVSVMSSLL